MNKLSILKKGNTSIVMVMAPIGSFYENPKYKGISHFVEHMCFKGNPNRNAKEISSAIDNVGGNLNAFTSEEMTCYWAKISNRYLPLAKEVIYDLAAKPTFPEAEVEKEREVIIQELKMYADDPKYAVYDLFNKILYKKSSGYYESIIGTLNSLKDIHRNELVEFHLNNYKDLTMIVVGNDCGQSKIKITLPKTQNHLLLESPSKHFQYRKNITQANIIMGNHLPLSEYNYATKLYMLRLLKALYSDMSGRLFTVIREKNNLVYRIHFSWNILRDNSVTWQVTLGLDAKNIKKAEKLIAEELSKPITTEMNFLVTKALGCIDMEYDNNYTVATHIASRLVNNKTYKDILDKNKRKYFDFSIKSINQFIHDMKFHKYSLVGILPKK